MALVKSTKYGASYQWGFASTDAPTIAGLTARGAELRYEPEVKSQATDGEGHVEGVTMSTPANRKITATFTGYVSDAWDPTGLANPFTFETRYYLITNIGEPRKKGDYWEVSIEAESYAGVTAVAS